MNLYVCVEQGTSPLSEVVREASRLFFDNKEWVLPSGPATHTFIAVGHDQGWGYRLDAVFPRSVLDVDSNKTDDKEARWEIIVPPERLPHLRACIASMIGRWYDLSELPTQLFAGFQKFPGLPRATICTHQVCDILVSAGIDLRLSNWFPETLARKMLGAERDGQTWLKRAMLPVHP